MTEEYSENCRFSKPGKILSIISLVCVVIGLIFWIILLTEKPNVDKWIKLIANILSAVTIITGIMGVIFNVITLIKIKYSLNEFSKKHLMFLIFCVVSTTLSIVFTILINK